MEIVSAYVYENGGVGDGNLTKAVSFPAGASSTASTHQVSQVFYDWEDHLVATKSGVLVTEAGSLSSGQIGFHVTGVSDRLIFDPSVAVRSKRFAETSGYRPAVPPRNKLAAGYLGV